MDKVFFGDSGSTAIEVAMKMAWQYFINIKQPQKTKFISFKNSYHGDTTGAMSLADLDSGMHEKFKDILLNNYSLKLPENEDELKIFEEFLKEKNNELAGIFIEPMVQCAGGMKFISPKITKEIYSLSKKYNILFVLDEIDKLSSSSQGDPASALLELSDPEQNNSFHDNFLEIGYDLSKVMFIATANSLSNLHPSLIDRMELINVTGYTTEEKTSIAQKFLIKKISLSQL